MFIVRSNFLFANCIWKSRWCVVTHYWRIICLPELIQDFSKKRSSQLRSCQAYYMISLQIWINEPTDRFKWNSKDCLTEAAKLQLFACKVDKLREFNFLSLTIFQSVFSCSLLCLFRFQRGPLNSRNRIFQGLEKKRIFDHEHAVLGST